MLGGVAGPLIHDLMRSRLLANPLTALSGGSADRVLWRQVRQRLCEYGALEAIRPAVKAKPEQAVTRKSCLSDQTPITRASRSNNMSLSTKTCEVLVRINKHGLVLLVVSLWQG